MKRIWIMFFALLVVLSFSATMFAANMPVKKSGKEKKGTTTSEYPMGPYQKAERGVINIALGWTEVPKCIVEVSNASNNPIRGLIVVTLGGLCKAVARTFSGIIDVATFPFGRYDKPMMMPDVNV